MHHWLGPDDDRAFHDHPWWFLTLVLRGGYADRHPGGEDRLRAGSVRIRPALYVIEALKRQMPMPAADRDRINVSRIAGIEIFTSEDMRPGEWELREHGETIRRGRIRTAAAEEQAARELTALTEELGLYGEDGGR